MIYQTDASSWNDFSDWVLKLKQERLKYKSVSELWVSEPLFRGQASASWKLQTTLERYEDASMDAQDFYSAIFEAKSQIESYTKQTWNISSPDEYSDWLDMQRALGLTDLPAYDYMVYLRHHGFPSPLLDWSASPFVAAYFAFAEASEKDDRVAIYGFMDLWIFLARREVGKKIIQIYMSGGRTFALTRVIFYSRVNILFVRNSTMIAGSMLHMKMLLILQIAIRIYFGKLLYRFRNVEQF